MKKRVAILISGRGSNMMALVEAARAPDYPAEIVTVISSSPDAAGLAWAKSQGLPAQAIDHKAYASREAFDEAVHAALDRGRRRADRAGRLHAHPVGRLSCASGRAGSSISTPRCCPCSRGCIRTRQALDAGVKISGCTRALRHRGDGQRADRRPGGGAGARRRHAEQRWRTRILVAEHRLYPHALALVASGRRASRTGGVRARRSR